MADTSLLAEGFGAVGFALLVAWPLLRGRRGILAGQAASAAAYGIHYALIGAMTGAVMLLLSVTQALAAWNEERSKTQGLVYAATIPALVVLTWMTWKGPISICAAAGLVMSSLGRWQRSPLMLRLMFLGSGVAWIAHDMLAGSAPALLGDLLATGALVYGLWRDRRRPPVETVVLGS